ncbi:hypothetical protein V6N11_018399 [Hibiscus sabdariffa]|uniref:Uncharacterized protein n=1 Tax=Hibiscus sabdariffa TaxID=183260 RepID=A0ABR2T7Q3_9ROSI
MGVVPNGVSGVLSLLRGLTAGVVARLVEVVWLETGTTGGEAAGVCCGSAWVAGAEGPASSVGAAAVWIGLAGGVGIAMLSGVASATSIFRMYFALVQPIFLAWYLSPWLVGMAARLQSAEMRQGKAKMPLSFAQEAAVLWPKFPPC